MKKLAALVLAAGESKRYGPDNKLLETLGNKPILQRVLDCFEGIPYAERTIVVSPRSQPEIRHRLSKDAWRIHINPHATDGMGSSLACGIRSLPKEIDGVVVALGDMPLLERRVFRHIYDLFQEQDCEQKIICFRYQGSRGHPVGFGKGFFAKLSELQGDTGARSILQQHRSNTINVDWDDPGILIDCDTPAAKQRAETQLKNLRPTNC